MVDSSQSSSIVRSSGTLPPSASTSGSERRISLRRPASTALSSSHTLPPPSSNNSGSVVTDDDADPYSPESEGQVRAREDADEMNEVIMAVDLRGGTVGCAYYVTREEKLFLMGDVKMAGIDIVDTLKMHAEPTVVLINTRSDEALETALSIGAKGNAGEENRGDGKWTFDQVKESILITAHRDSIWKLHPYHASYNRIPV